MLKMVMDTVENGLISFKEYITECDGKGILTIPISVLNIFNQVSIFYAKPYANSYEYDYKENNENQYYSLIEKGFIEKMNLYLEQYDSLSKIKIKKLSEESSSIEEYSIYIIDDSIPSDKLIAKFNIRKKEITFMKELEVLFDKYENSKKAKLEISRIDKTLKELNAQCEKEQDPDIIEFYNKIINHKLEIRKRKEKEKFLEKTQDDFYLYKIQKVFKDINYSIKYFKS